MSHRKHKKKKQEVDFTEFQQDKPEEKEKVEETPKEESDCCDKCIFASCGYMFIFLAMFVIFFTERGHKYSQKDITTISNNIQLLDISKQKPHEINTLLEDVIENKKPLHFVDIIAGINEKDMIVMDDRTELSYPGIALKITSEMYQWIETQETEQKNGKSHTKYTYAKKWSKKYHDSSLFNKKDDYYNPQPTVSQLATRNVWVDDVVIGKNKHVQFHLAKSLYTKLSKRSYWKNAAKYSDMETWEMRDGYLFRPYDKAESWFPETDKDKKTEETKPDKPTDKSANSTSADETNKADDDAEKKEEAVENDDVFKKTEKVKEDRVKLSKPRLMIGDIRMTVLSLDPRGETLSYLGGMKRVADWNQNVLVPWKSPNNAKFVNIEYGTVSAEEILQRFSTEDITKLWLSRIFTFVSMFVGFMSLQGVTNTLVMSMKLPIGPLPLATWPKAIIASLALSAILWITIVAIAYLVGIVHLALTFVVLICGKLLVSNKAIPDEAGEKEKDLKTTAKQKKTQ